jgi:hypothetical protein
MTHGSMAPGMPLIRRSVRQAGLTPFAGEALTRWARTSNGAT